VNPGRLRQNHQSFEAGKLRVYLLSIDYDREALWTSSTSTAGVSFAGSAKLSDTSKLTYRLELASQNDTGNNPGTVEADYARADLGFVFGKVTLGAGYELLCGSPENGAFSTPLATLHKFNGWADKFLSTPASGLQDIFVSVGAKLGSWNLLAVYHEFSADSGGASYGTEIDGSVVYNAPWKQQFAFKFASYDADHLSLDTIKFWIWTRWGF
jgi:hypothetical protein